MSTAFKNVKVVLKDSGRTRPAIKKLRKVLGNEKFKQHFLRKNMHSNAGFLFFNYAFVPDDNFPAHD